MLKMLGSIALAMILCLALALPALADDPLPPIDWPAGTEDAPAEAAFTKILQMGKGTTTPDATFDFLFTPISVNGVNYDGANMPKIGNEQDILSLSFDATDTGTTTTDKKLVIKQSDNFLEGLPWLNAGVYIYKVKEVSTDFKDTDQATMTLSNAEYDLYVYVENGKDGLYVYLVGALITVIDTEDGGKVGKKVDPTPDGDKTIDGDYSKMIFTNYYLKTTTEEPDPFDEGAFFISKTVAEQFADESKYFEFKITVSSPAIPTASNTYKAYVVDDKDQVVTSDANFKGTLETDDFGNYIEFTADTELEVYLKHGQKLVFVDMYVGGSFTVTETGNADYTPTCTLYALDFNNVVISGPANGPLTAPETGVATLGEAANSAAFKNTYKSVTPTGISVDNLPYFIMIAMALLALTGFVFVKTRLGAKSNA
jgi:hypothetical protein